METAVANEIDFRHFDEEDNEGGGEQQMLIKADNIALEHQRMENEIIPLGPTKVEVVLAEVPINNLRLDPTNPRIQFRLRALGKDTSKIDQAELVELLWNMPAVKDLKRSIEANGGLIEAIIVSGKDGTVLEGNGRLTAYLKLREEFGESVWSHIRARLLPPEVTRDMVDVLLGEIHIAGKNEWTPFEQANHLYKMHVVKGIKQDTLAQMYRQSKGYISAKIRAYKLMDKVFVALAQDKKKNIKDLTGQWSWFEEFYKKCKPSDAGKENPDRVYDGPALEEKFCEWVLDERIPKGEDVRKLVWMLEDKKAISTLEKDGIDKAFSLIAARKPAIASKLWKQIEQVTHFLNEMPHNEIEALREGDPAKANSFEALVKALERIKKELKK